jgi:hypothetical protein
MEQDEYIKCVLDDHLNDMSTYTRLSHDDAVSALKAAEKEIKTLVASYDYLLSKAEKTYFECFYHLNHHMKQFYITMKIDKNPMGTRPIVSCCGSFVEGFSIWLDFKMKSLIKFVPTYVQDSYQVLRELKDLDELPHNARLFTADAVSIYTNINTEHGIQVFHEWLMDLKDDLPSDFPTPLFLKVLEIVMSKNIFQFDDLFFCQEEGTVMGTSTAVLYATIYYGRHEKTTLIPQFSACFQYFK